MPSAAVAVYHSRFSGGVLGTVKGASGAAEHRLPVSGPDRTVEGLARVLPHLAAGMAQPNSAARRLTGCFVKNGPHNR